MSYSNPTKPYNFGNKAGCGCADGIVSYTLQKKEEKLSGKQTGGAPVYRRGLAIPPLQYPTLGGAAYSMTPGVHMYERPKNPYESPNAYFNHIFSP